MRSLVFETCGRLGGEGTKLLRDLVTTAAAADVQCSPHAVGRWRTQLERVLLIAQVDAYLRALGSRTAERPAAEPPLLLAEERVYSSVWRCMHCDSHVKVRLTEMEAHTHTDTHTDTQTQTHRHRHTETQRQRHRHRDTHKHTQTHTDTQTHKRQRQRDRDTHRHNTIRMYSIIELMKRKVNL